jgi:hypothetical protein
VRVLSPLVALVLLPTLVLSACGKSNTITVKRNPDVNSEAQSPTSAKGSSTCLAPKNVLVGIKFTCADGKTREGTLVLGTPGTSLPACSADNEKGCLTTEAFSAFAKVERAK